jgi:hypothetical protein
MEYPLQNQFSHVRYNEIKIENFTLLQQQMFIYMRRNEKEQGWNGIEWNRMESNRKTPSTQIYIQIYYIKKYIYKSMYIDVKIYI